MTREPSKTPKAYSYLRYSTPEQMRGDSFRRQTELAERYAATHGLELDDKLTFEDLGVSAYKGANTKAALGAFREAVHVGQVAPGSYLLVENLDRISRQEAGYALRLLQDICSDGVTVVTLTDGREYTAENVYTDIVSIIMSLLYFARAHDESELKARRLRAAWTGKRANAREKPLTARVPAWLYLNKQTGRFHVIGERAEIVRRVFKMTLRGMGQHAIAETLNQERVPVFGRGKRWHSSYIVKIVASPTVIGTLVPHQLEHKDGKRKRKPLDPVPGYYPAVVDAETFQRTQSLKDRARAPLRGRHAKKELQNIFGGLARCPRCGSAMVRVYKGKPPKGGTYLACSKAKEGAGCKYHAVRFDYVERAFLESAGQLLSTVPAGDDSIDKEVDRAEAAIAALSTQIENVLNAIQRKGSSALSARLQELEDELETARQRHNELLQRQADTAGPLVERKVTDLVRALREQPMNKAEVNALLRQLLTGMIVDYQTGQLVFQWKQGGESDVIFAWPDERKKSKRRVRVRQRTLRRLGG